METQPTPNRIIETRSNTLCYFRAQIYHTKQMIHRGHMKIPNYTSAFQAGCGQCLLPSPFKPTPAICLHIWHAVLCLNNLCATHAPGQLPLWTQLYSINLKTSKYSLKGIVRFLSFFCSCIFLSFMCHPSLIFKACHVSRVLTGSCTVGQDTPGWSVHHYLLMHAWPDWKLPLTAAS
jgi:hypothetical protein